MWCEGSFCTFQHAQLLSHTRSHDCSQWPSELIKHDGECATVANPFCWVGRWRSPSPQNTLWQMIKAYTVNYYCYDPPTTRPRTPPGQSQGQGHLYMEVTVNQIMRWQMCLRKGNMVPVLSTLRTTTFNEGSCEHSMSSTIYDILLCSHSFT